MGRNHELYDVHCKKTRWWVITEPTNLYQQSDFPEVEQAFIFHLGLGVFMAERSRSELEDPETEQHITRSWRRFKQAVDAMNGAEESEDFQAVGIKCRDALIALAKDHATAAWVGPLESPPKAADFKGWGNIFVERLTESGRLRRYVKELVDKTWDLTVWLQHEANATPMDADIVLEATGLLLGLFAKLIRRREHGDPDRCPRCESYRVRHDLDPDRSEDGFWVGSVCASCGWSEQSFTTWQEHFDSMDIDRVKEYLDRPGIVSDRLHSAAEGD
ncbi:hypothetical protein GCM10023258_39840 [Terrabacter aeriphilus]|uniref:Uncharacterized protein n=2 Tax=Terrabacter aeriphilus TaxID=515662 RepID=A0ABP9JNK6_9MICO